MTPAISQPRERTIAPTASSEAIQDGRSAPHPFSPRERLGRAVWKLCQSIFVRSLPVAMSSRQVAILRLFGAQIGTGTQIHGSVSVEFPWLLEIGDLCVIGPRARIYNLGRIRIGRHSVLSQGAHLCAGTHDYQDPLMTLRRDEISIGSGCWLCAETFVGPGLTIGNHAVVGARAVVTKNVPERAVVAGNPARIVKWRSFHQTASGCEV